MDGAADFRAIHTVAGIAEQSGGPSRSVTNLCSAIARAGISVDLVSAISRGTDERLVTPDADRVRLHLVNAVQISAVRFCPQFGGVIDRVVRSESGPAVIHDHGAWSMTNVSARRAANRNAVPYVLSPRGMLEPWALNYKARRKRLAWALYQQRVIATAAALVATSELECGNVKRLFPKLAVAVIPNGVTLPEEDESRGVRDSHSGGRLLFMSRVHPKKNLIALVQAWKEVCAMPSTAGWLLQIAGPDELDHLREIKALVHSFALDSRVEYLGPISESEKAAVLNAADLFVLPSFSENFGLVVAEALAHGVPVIATRGTPWAALVEKRCGWWVDPTPTALARALCEAIDLTPAERIRAGLRGQEYAKAAFSWDEIGTATVQLYEWILGRTTSTPSFVHV